MKALPVTSVFNDGYIAELYDRFRNNPDSVDESWRQYFRFAEQLAGATPAATPTDARFLRKVAGAADLVSAIQRYGHMCVQIDPLGTPPIGAAEMKPEFHGITEADLSQIPAPALGGQTGTAADVVARMRRLWCGAIGFEYDHLEEDKEREWFRQTIESQRLTAPLSNDERREHATSNEYYLLAGDRRQRGQPRNARREIKQERDGTHRGERDVCDELSPHKRIRGGHAQA